METVAPAAPVAVVPAAVPAPRSGAVGPAAVAVLRRPPAAGSAAATAAVAAVADGADARARDLQCRVHGVWVVQQPAVARIAAAVVAAAAAAAAAAASPAGQA